jgi:hypothetical protein
MYSGCYSCMSLQNLSEYNLSKKVFSFEHWRPNIIYFILLSDPAKYADVSDMYTKSPMYDSIDVQCYISVGTSRNIVLVKKYIEKPAIRKYNPLCPI